MVYHEGGGVSLGRVFPGGGMRGVLCMLMNVWRVYRWGKEACNVAWVQERRWIQRQRGVGGDGWGGCGGVFGMDPIGIWRYVRTHEGDY